MEKAVKDFAQREEHANSDSTFVVLMSHGKRDAILGVHYSTSNPSDTFPVDHIYRYLNTENCPGLRDKPKVILIQACRGGTNKMQLFIAFFYLSSQGIISNTSPVIVDCIS